MPDAQTKTTHDSGPRYAENLIAFDLEEGEWVVHIPDSIKTVSATESGQIKAQIRALPHLLAACRDFIYGNKPENECEADMLAAIRIADEAA